MVVTARAALVIFAILAHLGVAAVSPWLLVLVAPLSGILLAVGSRAMAVPFGSRRSAALTAGAASLAGTLAVMAMGAPTPVLAAAPLLAMAGAAAFPPERRRASSFCARCRSPRPKEELIRCPRCAGYVCTRCYIPQLSRCAICQEKRNRLLSDDPAWWSAQLGSRVYNGSCKVCMRSGEDPACDLRVCLNCGWPVCTDCWDDCNAQCASCGWRLLDISDRMARTRYTREEPGSSYRSR